ncbi:MAG: sxtJ [Candidatus Omnitrophica bacterium]|nr:sxtJ [Candidatus Omnitrophota bacterium]
MNLDNKEIQKFVITVTAGFLILGLIVLLKGNQIYLVFWALALALFILRLVFYPALIPVYKAWMGLAHVLAWINTRIILVFIFFLVFTPIGLIMRLFRIDILERRIHKEALSYWKRKDHEEFHKEQFEHQF